MTHLIKLAAAVIAMVLFVPAAADASHEDYRPRCMGRLATIVPPSIAGPVRGTEGDDVIAGSISDDVILGLGGDDIICGGEGDDIVDAGDGNDAVSTADGSDEVFGRGGLDLLSGGSGSDLVVGDEDDDIIRGGPDGLPVVGERDTVWGGAGNDLLLNGAAIDSFAGGADEDTYAFSSRVALVDLDRGVAVSESDSVDSLGGIENVLGFAVTGESAGQASDPVIRGDAAANILVGSPGSDHIFGNDGTDLIDGYCGADELNGGPGDGDVASFRFQHNVVASLEGPGSAVSPSCSIGPVLRRSVASLSAFEGLAGGYSEDRLTGDDRNNYLYGYYGVDRLLGMAGDDVLDASFQGGDLSGGDGSDRCVYGIPGDDCEYGAGPTGPRRRDSVELLQRFQRLLLLVQRAQQMRWS